MPMDYYTRVANADDCSGFRSFLYFPINEPSSAIPATLPTICGYKKGNKTYKTKHGDYTG